jgi:pyruvate kinase
LRVTAITPPQIECLVVEGGRLSNNKGINRKGGGLAARTLTHKDKQDLETAVGLDVDYITLSFVKDATDINHTRKLLAKYRTNLPIIAKIERTEALTNLNAIIQASDGVMVARGDLGVEVGAAEVPALQKHIISQARFFNKVVITATQMMESMIQNPQPTRAEVSDVANAILDGTDAVMLSAETASGKYPVKVISMVDKICLSAEKHAALFYKNAIAFSDYEQSNQAIAMAAMHLANHFPIKAILALTESGATAIWMSRLQSTVPIFALTDKESTVRKLSVVNNVFPFYFDYRPLKIEDINQALLQFLSDKNMVTPDTYVLITRGQLIGVAGGTNSLEIIKVGDLK